MAFACWLALKKPLLWGEGCFFFLLPYIYQNIITICYDQSPTFLTPERFYDITRKWHFRCIAHYKILVLFFSRLLISKSSLRDKQFHGSKITRKAWFWCHVLLCVPAIKLIIYSSLFCAFHFFLYLTNRYYSLRIIGRNISDINLIRI